MNDRAIGITLMISENRKQEFFIWNFGNVGHFVNFGETVCLPNFFNFNNLF